MEKAPQDEMQHYIYDASGERVLKAGSAIEGVYENGSLISSSVTFNAYTTYPSAFIVVNGDGEYSKHYYAGSQRVVSRIGDQPIEMFIDQEGFAGRPAPGAGEGEDANNSSFDAEKLRRLQISDLTLIMEKAKRGAPAFKKYEPKDQEQEDQQEGESLEKSGLQEPQQTTMMAPPQGLIYFYHPDHLGTSTFLTDMNGDPYQFFLNLPFGENMVEQHSQTEDWETPYKFNGKELDPETGYYYYGARYYDPRASIWLSTDPLMEKYPNVNPYVYCLENPLRYIDPTGRMVEDGDNDDIYKVDKNGSITLVEKTDDDYDILYAVDNTEPYSVDASGEIDCSKSIIVEKGVLDKYTTETYSGNKYDYMTMEGDANATNLFEFLAENTNVEWAHIQYGENLNFIGTSHDKFSVYAGTAFLNKAQENNIFHLVKVHTHSHPDFPITGIGESENDRDAAKEIESLEARRFGDKRMIHRVYDAKRKQYTNYSSHGSNKD